MNIHVYISIYIYIYIYTWVTGSNPPQRNIYIFGGSHTYMRKAEKPETTEKAEKCIYTYMDIYIYVYMYVHTCIYIYV